jgi:hypothetical protein
LVMQSLSNCTMKNLCQHRPESLEQAHQARDTERQSEMAGVAVATT